jgi:hypothetical protein
MARNNKQIKTTNMTKTNTILEKYKEPFLNELETACILYKLIGNGTHESPMWFQLYKLKTLNDRFKYNDQHNPSFYDKDKILKVGKDIQDNITKISNVNQK